MQVTARCSCVSSGDRQGRALLAAGASVLPAHQYATGTGISNTARQVGSAIGVAALVSVLGVGLTVGDYRAGWWLMAAAGAIAALVAPLLKARPAQARPAQAQSAERRGGQPESL
jgi:hypothetical protein